MKNPPILISVIGFFAALAGFAWLFVGLRMLGFDWFGALGDLPAFEQVGPLGLARDRHRGPLAPRSRSASGRSSRGPGSSRMIVAGVALFEAFLAFFQFPGTGIGLGMSIMPIVILLYLNSAGVKAAFGLKDPPPAA